MTVRRGRGGFTLLEAAVGVALVAALVAGLAWLADRAGRPGRPEGGARDPLGQVELLSLRLLEDLQALSPDESRPPTEWLSSGDLDGDGRAELGFRRIAGIDPAGRVRRVHVEYEARPATATASGAPVGPTVLRTERGLREGARPEVTTFEAGGLGDFAAVVRWTWRGARDGAWREAVTTAPGPGDVPVRVWVEVSFVLGSASLGPEAAASLPVSFNVFPRELNRRLQRRWIDD